MVKYPLTGAMTRFALIAMLSSISWAAHALASNTVRHPIDIPSQNLANALQELSKQCQTNLIYRPEQVAGLRSRGLVGMFSAEQAASRLIEGTPLTVSMDSTGALLIAAPLPSSENAEPDSAAEARKEGKTPSSVGFRVAQVDQGAPPQAVAMNAEDQQLPDKDAENQLQEIIVTAQKFRQPAYNVPVALSVINANTIQRFGATSLENLQYQVPGLWVQSDGAQRRIFIDGVANESGNGALVSEYLDDADVTASPNLFAYASLDLRTYDLARVEVLRGPQGTLYGEGAEGGAIHYVSNQPDLNEYQFGLRGESLFTKNGAPSQRVFPVLNIPLVPDELGIRIAGEYSHQGGWIDEPTAQLKNINSSDLTDTRIEALWRPSEQFSLNLMEIIHRKSFGLNYGSDNNENYTAPFGLPISPHEQDQYNVSNVTARYDLPEAVALTNSATYVRDVNSSGDLGSVDPAFGLNELFYNRYSFGDFSDEFRLTNEGVAPASPWQWTIGGFFKHAVVSNYPSGFCLGLNTSTVGTDALISPSLPERIAACNVLPDAFWLNLGSDISSKQHSEFADVSYTVLSRLTLGAGARYFKDQQHHFAVGVSSQSAAFTSTDPRVYALYKVTEHVNVYASVAKGFRSGGFNTLGALPFEPESLWYYDLGTKTHGLGAFDVSADAYYGNYTDFQSVGLADNISITRNGGIVHIKGGDATVQWRLGHGWRVSVDGEYTNARVVSLGGFTETPQLVGELVNLTLRYQLNGTVEKDFRVGGRPGYATVGYTQRPGVSFDFIPGTSVYSANMYILNAASGVQWNDNLSMGLMIQNGLDDRGFLFPGGYYGTQARQQPLTVGVYLDATF